MFISFENTGLMCVNWTKVYKIKLKSLATIATLLLQNKGK